MLGGSTCCAPRSWARKRPDPVTRGPASIRTTCAHCGVGCGISATVTGPRSVTIRGDAEHPANAGRLCSKGTHLGETVGLEGRLLHPMIGHDRVSWDAA